MQIKIQDFFKFSPLVLFYSLWIVSNLIPEASPALFQFDGQQIGEATLKGIDISKRVSGFYTYILLFPVVWIAVSIVLRLGVFQFPAVLTNVWNSLAWAGSFQLLCAYFNPVLYQSAWYILAVQVFLILQQFITGNKQALLQRSLISISVGILIQILLNWLFSPQFHQAIISSFSVIGMLLISFRIRKMDTVELSNGFNAAFPLFLAGLLPFIVTEFKYFLLVRFHVNTAPFLLFLIGCVLLNVWVILLLKRSVPKQSFKRTFELVLLILLLGLGIQTFYQPYGIASTEVFELANRALPLQEFHFFRTIPLLEKASSHFVSDYGFGLLYNLIYGYHGLDFLIFDVFEKLFWISITFTLLNRIFRKPFLSFYILALFPFADALFSPYFCWTFIPLLILMANWKHPTKGNAWLLGISVALLMLWRADIAVGIICCLSVVCLIGLVQKRFTSSFLVPTGVCLLILGLILYACCLILNIDWISNLKSTLNYLSSSQSYGLVSMGNEQLNVWKFHHLVLPIVIAVCMIISLRELFIQRRISNQFPWLVILFMGVFYLVNFQRGLIRHGFVEGSDNFLSSYALLIVPLSLVFKLPISNQFRAVYFLGFTLILQLFIRFPGREPETGMLFPGKFNLKEIESNHAIQRYLPDAEYVNQQYTELSNFLKTNLKANETFIDLGNNPMLYYYAEKEVPAFFFQSPLNVHSISLQKDWIRRLEKFDVPIVLFRHVPKLWWDETDGVPNEMRNYAITEHVYTNYVPFKEIGGYEVWKKRGSLTTMNPIAFFEKRYSEEFQLGLIPEFMHTHSTAEVNAFYSKQSTGYLIKSAKGTVKKPMLLKLTLQSQSRIPREGKLNFFKYGKPMGAFLFTVSPIKNSNLELRLSIHPTWAFYAIDSLQLDLPVDSIHLNAANFAVPLN